MRETLTVFPAWTLRILLFNIENLSPLMQFYRISEQKQRRRLETADRKDRLSHYDAIKVKS